MGCLALNASYEPLTIIPVQRAICLLLDRKAEALEVDANRPVRSQNLRLQTPVVIRLAKFIHVPHRFRRQVNNTFLFARDGYRCVYCKRTRAELARHESLTRDHVVPLARGGGNTWDNVVTSCGRCNLKKADRLPRECGMTLSVLPREPNHVELVWAVRRVTPVQAKYVRLFYGEDVLAALKPGGPANGAHPQLLSTQS
ncbi:MAG: HNH endonuclease [Gemmatimonadetes bacterium]|nr:HNH endonuclease [Gemmatimonadota bacterium]